jgi:hypothetical protein
VPHSGPAIVIPIAYAVIFLGGIAWGLVLKSSNRPVYDGIGQGTRSNAAGTSELSALLDEPTGFTRR